MLSSSSSSSDDSFSDSKSNILDLFLEFDGFGSKLICDDLPFGKETVPDVVVVDLDLTPVPFNNLLLLTGGIKNERIRTLFDCALTGADDVVDDTVGVDGVDTVDVDNGDGTAGVVELVDGGIVVDIAVVVEVVVVETGVDGLLVGVLIGNSIAPARAPINS